MFRFNIKSTDANQEEISTWFADRDAKYEITVTEVTDWWGAVSKYQVYDIGIDDENVAIEFRLAFDSKHGESYELSHSNIETELQQALSVSIQKEIDKQIIESILSTATIKTSLFNYMYGCDFSNLNNELKK